MTDSNTDDNDAIPNSVESLGVHSCIRKDSMSKSEFQEGFHRALVEAGYDSREKIIALVREVKLELYEERRRQS